LRPVKVTQAAAENFMRKTARREQRGEATVKILGIVTRPSAPGQDPKFIVTADDKTTYQTFVKAHAEAAKSAQEAGIPIAIQYRQESFGRVIESIAERDAQEPPL
jgi:biopolymer transport protein ExbD